MRLPSPTVFSVLAEIVKIFRCKSKVVLGIRREASALREFLVACPWFFFHVTEFRDSGIACDKIWIHSLGIDFLYNKNIQGYSNYNTCFFKKKYSPTPFLRNGIEMEKANIHVINGCKSTLHFKSIFTFKLGSYSRTCSTV